MHKIYFNKLHLSGWKYPVKVSHLKEALATRLKPLIEWGVGVTFRDSAHIRQLYSQKEDWHIIASLSINRMGRSGKYLTWFPVPDKLADTTEIYMDELVFPSLICEVKKVINSRTTRTLWVIFRESLPAVDIVSGRGNTVIKRKIRDIGMKFPGN